MEKKRYIFKVSSYNIAVNQVSRALEKRTELVSREKYPKMWKYTDKLDNKQTGSTRTKVYSVLCLLLGIFLFVPGLVKPKELAVPLLVGAAAIGAGIGGFVRIKRSRKDPFEKSANLLLSSMSKAEGSEVSFDDAGMSFDTELVPYNAFEFVIENTDIYVIFYDTRVTLLQKKDLADGENGFAVYLKEKTTDKYYYIGE